MRDPRRVAVVAYQGLCTFEFGIVVEVFALPRPELDVPWYSFRVCSVEPGPLTAMGGVTVRAQSGLGGMQRAGTIVIPGWRDADETPPQSLLRALQQAYRQGARIVSICSGVFVLAAAGLLDGRRVTTHWRYAERLARRFPRVRVEPDVCTPTKSESSRPPGARPESICASTSCAATMAPQSPIRSQDA